jgi:hypothetical protein
MEIVEAKIKDRNFTKLIWKALRAGYLEEEAETIQHSIAGTPQGSIITPILANVYLDQLDRYVEALAKEFDNGGGKNWRVFRRKSASAPGGGGRQRALRASPARRDHHGPYSKDPLMKIAKARGDMKTVSMGKNRMVLSYKHLSSVDWSVSLRDPSYRRMVYCRYADEWIIGIRGSHRNACEILDRVREFLKDKKLTLSDSLVSPANSPSTTKITNLNKGQLLFLGTHIFRSGHQRVCRSPSAKRLGNSKRLALGLRMEAPIMIICSKLTDAGFLTKGAPAPKFIWMHLDVDQIIHLYNGVIRGIGNYYSFVHNRSKMARRVNWIMKYSALKLLAAKYQTTISKIIRKYGADLSKGTKTKLLQLY